MASFLQLLESKRDGAILSADQVRDFVSQVVDGSAPDYQIAAFLMAIFFRGLNPDETAALTLAMRDSGERLEFPADGRPLVDKHSTGGVGDKVSLVLAPLLACFDLRVPMLAGRGLGITGGTLDKMEAIPGVRTRLSREHIVAQVQNIGCCIAGQTERMVPADRILYALRDVTGTVPSIPLITASILSKKLVESLDALVLDVMWGRAAFMRTREDASRLGRSLVDLATSCGVRTRAVLTAMNSPLGCSAGNWLEVVEVEQLLRGQGPSDVRSLVVELAAEVLCLTHRVPTLEEARTAAQRVLESRRPFDRWRAMITAQGADLATYERQLSAGSPLAPCVRECTAPRGGYVEDCDAALVGEVVRLLGGGRLSVDAIPDLRVGVDSLRRIGERIEPGDVLLRVHASSTDSLESVWGQVTNVHRIGDRPVALHPLIQERIGALTT